MVAFEVFYGACYVQLCMPCLSWNLKKLQSMRGITSHKCFVICCSSKFYLALNVKHFSSQSLSRSVTFIQDWSFNFSVCMQLQMNEILYVVALRAIYFDSTS